jgi:hypothetical protein
LGPVILLFLQVQIKMTGAWLGALTTMSGARWRNYVFNQSPYSQVIPRIKDGQEDFYNSAWQPESLRQECKFC